jgi:hypothetical protein
MSKTKGQQKKNEKKQPMYVRTLFGQDWTFVHVRWRDFFYRVFEFPLSRNAQKRTKRKSGKGGKK